MPNKHRLASSQIERGFFGITAIVFDLKPISFQNYSKLNLKYDRIV